MTDTNCRIIDLYLLIKEISINNRKLHIATLKQHFEGKNEFKTADIADFFKLLGAELKPTTLNWRIHNLVQKGVLERTGKGIFRIGKTTAFIPELDDKHKTIHNQIQSEFPYIDFCIWNTDILNQFTLHYANRPFTLIEIEKDIAEVIFLVLREKHKNVFFNPSSEILENYVFTAQNPIIVRSLISEAPLQKAEGFNTVTLEKILVDLYSDRHLFSFYQGKEMRTIFKTAYEKYTINNTRLLRYASRRGKREEIENYTNQIIGRKN